MAPARKSAPRRPASPTGQVPFVKRGPSRERRFDLILDGVGFIVAGADTANPAWIEDSFATELGGQHKPGEVQEEIKTNHLGYGYSEFYIPGCYDYAVNMDASHLGVIIMGPLITTITGGFASNVTDFFEIGGNLYAVGGRYCKSVDVSADTVAVSKDFGASTTPTKAINFNGKVYVGFSSDTSIYSFTGATTTTVWDNVDPTGGGATTVRARYWAKDYLDSYGWRLWRGYIGSNTTGVNGTGVSGDPLDDTAWGPATPLTVGDTSAAITGMTGTEQTIWVCKEDGLYSLDYTGRGTNVLKPMEQLASSNNGINPIIVGSQIILPHVLGLISYNMVGGHIELLQPGTATASTSPVYGRTTAQVSLGHWHYLALYNGTDTYLLKGRRPTPLDPLPQGFAGPIIWHPIAKFASTTVNAMWITGLTTPNRLYLGVGTDVAYITISPTNNQLAETGHKYAASGNFYYSPVTFRADGTTKELMTFDVENEGLAASTYAQLQLSIDGGAYTQWGLSLATAGRTRLPLPNTGSWRGYRTKMRLDLTNADTTTTPKIKAVVPRAALRPSIQDLVTTKLYCVDSLKLRDGSTNRDSGRTLLDKLKELRDTGPKTVVDYWNGKVRSRTAIVERVTETIIEQLGDDPAGFGAEVTIRFLKNLGTYFKWDGQSYWDGSHKWT